jgi:hypothetical protein
LENAAGGWWFLFFYFIPFFIRFLLGWTLTKINNNRADRLIVSLFSTRLTIFVLPPTNPLPLYRFINDILRTRRTQLLVY